MKQTMAKHLILGLLLTPLTALAADPGPGIGAPGPGVRPGVGAGAPGVGVAPGPGVGAPGPGVAPEGVVKRPLNRGGPVNRVGPR